MTPNATALANLPPTPDEVINLAYVDLVIAAIGFPLSVWIAWKHGKLGMVSWAIFNNYFIACLVADIYMIVNRSAPMIPTAVSSMTAAAKITILSLTVIGIVYEANTCLPQPPKRWTEKIILGVTHLTNTLGISLAMYGGAPSQTASGLKNQTLAVVGSVMMLGTIAGILYWVFPSRRFVASHAGHPNYGPASILLKGALIAGPLQLCSLLYMTAYHFHPILALNPVMGSFSTKLVLVFGLQNLTAVALCWCGWVTMSVMPPNKVEMSRIGSGPNHQMSGHESDKDNLNREWSRDDVELQHGARYQQR